MNATVTPERGMSYTQYRISGAFDAVCVAIKTIFSEYDPRGYGTKVRSLEMELDGTYTAQVWRGNNAD